ncbi:hypothetical protein Moror_11530 [Moniliophthora roreri MCA 2997]|uniref:Uncharacterized protein n=1 Tax=Moniliophthora roreri (strain MCA 2997) TaxID=1381753 RepID=V2XX69_MONRO|nr:hypothetical protein Moror_11530 [Moniliophthora roreri MCA 2997]
MPISLTHTPSVHNSSDISPNILCNITTSHSDDEPMDTLDDDLFISNPDGFGLFRIHRYYTPANDVELNQQLEDVYEVSDDETEPIRRPEEVYGKCSKEVNEVLTPLYYALFDNPSTM